MSGPDDGLRVLFHRNLKQDFAWTAIETGGTGLGIADSNYLHRSGVEGWIEMKSTDGWIVDLSEFQAAWLERRVRYGGRAWIAVRRRCARGPRRAAADELWLLPGSVARAARAGGLREPSVVAACLGTWPGGPARWPWQAVGALLRGPVRPVSAPSAPPPRSRPANPG